MRKIYLLLLSFLTFSSLWSCDSKSEAEVIVDNAIKVHGGEKYATSKISFDFRDKHYEIFKGENSFSYSREFQDSLGRVQDLLNNNGFSRSVNEVEIDTLTDERIGAFSRSVNSVAYFAFLPYGLDDPAAFKEYLGITDIKGEAYHQVKVTFQEEGGGEDFDDIFLYWIGVEDFYVDYIAYSYHTDGGGVRFREVSEVSEVGGIRFQNYLNLKPSDKNTPIDKIQELYLSGELLLLSKINLENIRVN